MKDFMSPTLGLLLISTWDTKSMRKGREYLRVKLKGDRVVASEIDWAIITRLSGDFHKNGLFFAQTSRILLESLQRSVYDAACFSSSSKFSSDLAHSAHLKRIISSLFCRVEYIPRFLCVYCVIMTCKPHAFKTRGGHFRNKAGKFLKELWCSVGRII